MENKLIPLEHNNKRIMTTKVLAQEYGTEETNIQTNFTRNQSRFIEGKHYYKLEGQELKKFKRSLPTESMEPFKYVSQLILWTEKGAARHAKILDTDKAWEVYEELEDTYFKVQELKKNVELISAQNEIKELKKTIEESRLFIEDFKQLTSEAKEMYKPSHKRKLQYDKLIKSVTSDKEEYDIVKEWIYATLEIEKWEDISIEQNKKILEIISTVSRMLNIKRFEQITLF